MSQDSLERDRLLTSIAKDVAYLVEAKDNTTKALIDHAKTDDTRFNKIDETLNNLGIKDARFYGIIYGGSFVIAGITGFIVKVIFK